jgi:hypothetical protein
LTVAAHERISGTDVIGPVAALLVDPADQPSLLDLTALARSSRAFDVTHQDEDAGQAELLRDGLTFDGHGFAPGPMLPAETALQRIALPGDVVPAGLAMITLRPGPHLAGAGPLLPVVRMLAGLVTTLSDLPGVRAVAWLPARLMMSPAWFAEAVGAWLRGGPFPALALTGLARTDSGFASSGLAYFKRQDFVFVGEARGAIRLVDWLIVHDRVVAPCEVDLAGFGKVLLEPDASGTLRARGL